MPWAIVFGYMLAICLDARTLCSDPGAQSSSCTAAFGIATTADLPTRRRHGASSGKRSLLVMWNAIAGPGISWKRQAGM